MPTPTYNLIQEVTVSGSVTNSVSFTSIPTLYDDLVYVVKGKNALDEAVWLRFNSDSGATSYTYAQFRAAGGASGQGFNSGDTKIDLTIGSNETSDYWLMGQICQNLNTNLRKTGISFSFNGIVGSSWYATTGSFGWQSTSTISTITFLTSAGTNFVAGSIFQLYGIKGSN